MTSTEEESERFTDLCKTGKCWDPTCACQGSDEIWDYFYDREGLGEEILNDDQDPWDPWDHQYLTQWCRENPDPGASRWQWVVAEVPPPHGVLSTTSHATRTVLATGQGASPGKVGVQAMADLALDEIEAFVTAAIASPQELNIVYTKNISENGALAYRMEMHTKSDRWITCDIRFL